MKKKVWITAVAVSCAVVLTCGIVYAVKGPQPTEGSNKQVNSFNYTLKENYKDAEEVLSDMQAMGQEYRKYLDTNSERLSVSNGIASAGPAEKTAEFNSKLGQLRETLNSMGGASLITPTPEEEVEDWRDFYNQVYYYTGNTPEAVERNNPRLKMAYDNFQQLYQKYEKKELTAQQVIDAINTFNEQLDATSSEQTLD